MGRMLTSEQEVAIAARYAEGETTTTLAHEYGCSDGTIGNTIRRLGGQCRPKNRKDEDHPSYRGSRRLDANGYVLVRLPRSHPFYGMTAADKCIKEHRLVMAQHLGRPLRREETVHHINGDRQDNRIENLQLRIGHHGQGTPLCCAACGSTDIIPVELP